MIQRAVRHRNRPRPNQARVSSSCCWTISPCCRFAGASNACGSPTGWRARQLYAWQTGRRRRRRRATCSAGTAFKLDGDLDELTRDDTVMVCGGIDVQAATTKKLLSWLRREARRG